MTVEILQTHRLFASCEAALADRYVVDRLHEAADRAAFIAGIAPRVRGMASLGRVDAALMAALPNLEIIANFGVGYDGVDTAVARARNIRCGPAAIRDVRHGLQSVPPRLVLEFRGGMRT